MAELLEELAKAAGKVSDGIERGMDGAKLKWAILRLESNLDAAYTELGRYLSDHRDDLTEDECLGQITALYGKIDRLKADLSLLKRAQVPKKRCPQCGSTQRKADAFCPKCGEKL